MKGLIPTMEKKLVFSVEDDKILRSTIAEYLTMNGFDVLSAKDGNEAISLFEENIEKIDIVLLDVMLPYRDGFEVLRHIRKLSSVPVIIISARESEADQLTGFHLGADNYLTKPFMLSVMKEHINSILARVSPPDAKIIKAGVLTINKNRRSVMLDNAIIETTPKEYEVLCYLVENTNTVLSRENILDKIWGFDYYGDFRTVDTIIKQLRKKMTNRYPYIKSVYGVGYCFEISDIDS